MTTRSSGSKNQVSPPVGAVTAHPDGGRQVLPLLPVALVLTQVCTPTASAAAGDAELRLPPATERPGIAGDEPGEEILIESQASSATDPSSTTANVTIVPVDERLSESADVAQVLDSVAGTTVVHLGGLGDFSAVSIRGSSLRQVQIFLDGVPLNPDGSDVVNLSELPLRAFSRVEVWRGSAPPRYAAAPIGGVVDLITADDPGATTALTVGQHGTARAFAMDAFDGQLAGRRLDGLAVADLLHTAGDFAYFDDNGTIYTLTDDRLATRDNNDKTQLSAIARLRWGDRQLRLSLLDAVLVRDEGLPGHVQSPSADARLETTRNLAVAAVETHGSTGAAQGRLWMLERQETLDDRQGQLNTGAQWQRGRFTTVGAQGHGQWLPLPWLMPAATLAARRDAYVQSDLSAELVESPRVRWAGSGALSAELRWWQDRLLLTPVLQAQWTDNRALGTVPFSDQAVAPDDRQVAAYATPRLGLALRPAAALTLKANVGRTVRPPDLSELFGDRGAVIGNTDLLPERGLSWDIGARLAGEREGVVTGSLDLAHFWSRTQDLIVLVQNAQRTSIPVNFGMTWVQGLEAAATVNLAGWVDSQTALTWTISRNLTDDASVADNQLPRIPAWEASQATGLHWGERVRLGHTWTYTDGSYWDATNFYRAAPRSMHGAFLRLQPHPAWPAVEASLLNITDSIVQVVPRNPLDPSDDSRIVDAISDYAGYPLPGRTWMVTLRWSPRPPGSSP